MSTRLVEQPESCFMKPLLVFAMEQESQDTFDDYDVLHTGIGKVNAAHALTARIHSERPELVINMGTVGSRKHPKGSVLNPNGFVQRDMDVTPLGFEKFQTPFSDDPIRVEHGNSIDGLPSGVCGSGDNFATSDESAQFDCVDMEAYVLALICQREDIPFMCLKYVSDGADEAAHDDWNETLSKAAQALSGALKGAGY